jgi:hypothetical protein
MIKQKIKISPLDNLFSAYIRTRDGWTCRRCKQEFDPAMRSHLLDCSHIIPRGSWSVRLDERNSIALCKWKCHKWWHSEPVESTRWLLEEVLTLAEYQALRLRAKQRGFKRSGMDVGLIELELLQMIDDQFDMLNASIHVKCPKRFVDAAMEYLLRAKQVYLDGKIPKEIKRALKKQRKEENARR